MLRHMACLALLGLLCSDVLSSPFTKEESSLEGPYWGENAALESMIEKRVSEAMAAKLKEGIALKKGGKITGGTSSAETNVKYDKQSTAQQLVNGSFIAVHAHDIGQNVNNNASSFEKVNDGQGLTVVMVNASSQGGSKQDKGLKTSQILNDGSSVVLNSNSDKLEGSHNVGGSDFEISNTGTGTSTDS